MAHGRSLKARVILIGSMATAVAVGLSACGSSGGGSGSTTSSSSAKNSSYKVSIVGDLSGVLSAEGAPGVAGFQAAIDNINASGGVNGIKIDASSPIDTQSTTSGAEAGFRQAVGQNPLAILVSLSPDEEVSVQSLLSSTNVPVLSVTENDGLEGSTPQPWAFTANLTAEQSANSYTQYLSAALGGSLAGKTIALIGYDNAGPIGYMNAIAADVAKAGGKTLPQVLTEANTTSFATQAAKITQSKPAAVVSIDISTNTILEITALKAAGFTGPFAGGPAVQDPALLQKIASLDKNFAAPLIVQAPAPGDLMSTTAAKYGLSKQAQTVFFSGGWALAYTVAGALKKCGASCTGKELISALETAGPYAVPGNVLPTEPNFSATKHVAITSVQFTKWDSSANKVVSAGPQIPVS